MIPCLNKDALRLLVGTADERYEFSPDYFRNTHFPQIMHRYHGNQLIAEITENELFEDLLEVDSSGNRIFFIFGSTGSGKSELLCWIKDRWISQNTNRPVIRISRSELNPQVLIKKCYDTLNIPLEVRIDESRWELLLKKPITLINQIVWTTLAENLESDEEIVPVALLIRPIIEKNITEFTAQVQRGRITKPLEVLHRDQFEDLISNTTLKISLEYESIRKSLSHKLDQFLFEGWDIASLFKRLTNQLKVRSVRPLLLIDDLVQSVNIYATDLLDQLISLEEGYWDVVIGLTPGAIQDSEKGFDLNQRIQNLDTIHDRVKKYWLSDESGKEFYNLNRNQVVPYMANYLEQLKGSQGFTCSKECHHYNDCLSLIQNPVETERDLLDLDIRLLPFNRHMVKRIFDAIPLGKGKLRYMILNSKEIIRFFLKGKRDQIIRVIPLVKREKFADHTDLLVKTFAEWYAPEEGEKSIVTRQLLKHFGYHLGDTTINLHSLEGFSQNETEIKKVDFGSGSEQSEEKATIRDWVEGKQLNSELLEPVKLGVAALVHDIVKGVNISRSFTPKTSSVIQRKDVMNRTRYPISIENTEANPKVININRSYSALQIFNFQLLKPSEKGRVFQKISNEYETAKWVYQAETLQDVWKEKLEEELGVDIPTFAYYFKMWANTCAIFSNSTWASNIKIKSPFNSDLLNLAEQCYQDWYMLRDNLYQPIDTDDISKFDFEQWLQNYIPSRELENYQFGEVSLYAFIKQLKDNYIKYRDLLNETLKKVICSRMSMIPYLLDSNNEQFHQYATEIKAFSEKVHLTLEDYNEFTVLENALVSNHVLDQFTFAESLYKEVSQLKKQFQTLSCDIKSYLIDCGEKFTPNSEVGDAPSWKNLEEDKERFTFLVDDLTRLRNCLSSSPRNVLKQVIHSSAYSDEVVHIQTIWAQILEGANKLFNQQPVGEDLLHHIVVWQSIDFYKLKNQLDIVVKREEIKSNLIRLIRYDLKCDEGNDVTYLLELIDKNIEFRPAIKRQLRLLLEHGYSTLPPVQWRRLLDELKEKFPCMFEGVEIRLVASGND